MGACHFINNITTDTTIDMSTAFNQLVSDAGREHGHGGYTGTIAEKMDYLVITIPDNQTRLHRLPTVAQAEEWIDSFGCDYLSLGVDDKWGPAGAIQTTTGFIFFGWASS